MANWGKIYDSTWWGDGVSNAISWGKSYVDLAGNLSSQLLSALKSRATNYENNAGSKAILDEILDAELLEKASIVLTPTAYESGTLNSVKPSESPYDGDFDFTRGSTATRVNASSQVESVASNIPRIDYSDGVGKILLEPSSTNVIPYSEDFSQWTERDGASVESNYAVSPDGTQNADKLNFDGTNNGRVEYPITSGIVNGSEYTFSVWLKTLSGTAQALIGHGAWGLKQITVTDQWQRFTSTVTSTTTSSYPRVRCNSASDILAWGYQLEQQPYMTSYIPTGSTTVTRVAEYCWGSGNTELINSTEGVLYTEIQALADDESARTITLTDGTNDNTVKIKYQKVQSNAVLFQTKTTTGTGFSTTKTYTITNVNKFALKWDSSGTKCFANGSLINTNSNLTSFPADTLNSLSFARGEVNSIRGIGSQPFAGNIKCVAVFKEALTDTELQNLTS